MWSNPEVIHKPAAVIHNLLNIGLSRPDRPKLPFPHFPQPLLLGLLKFLRGEFSPPPTRPSMPSALPAIPNAEVPALDFLRAWHRPIRYPASFGTQVLPDGDRPGQRQSGTGQQGMLYT